MSDELLPCPFCLTGTQTKVAMEPFETGYYVECMECPKARGPLRANRAAAIAAWNRRAESADHAALVARIAELETELAGYRGVAKLLMGDNQEGADHE